MSLSHPEAVIDALNAGDLKVIDKYVNKDNVNRIDGEGYSLLSRAATATDLNMKIVRLLIRRGADVNIRLPQEQWTLLHSAAHLLRKDLALALIRAGCDPNAVDETGQSALTKVLFAFNPKADLVKILLEHGADPTIKQEGGESAMDLAARTGQAGLMQRNV